MLYWGRNKILGNTDETVLLIMVSKSVYSCIILLNFIGLEVLAQLFCFIRHEEWKKAEG